MINEGLDLSRAEVSRIRTDLDTVRLGVEGPAVVELQDDERQSVSLPHLLVVVQRRPLVKVQWVLRVEEQVRTKVFVNSYRLYFYLTVEGVVCAYFPQSRFGPGVQSDNKMNNWSDYLINNVCRLLTSHTRQASQYPGTWPPSPPSDTESWSLRRRLA